MKTRARAVASIRRGKFAVSTLACLLLCSCNNISGQPAQETRYTIIYHCWDSSVSPVITISLEIDRNELAAKLKKLVAEMYERWPNGADPNPVRLTADTITEQLTITRQDGRSIKFELAVTSRNVLESMPEEARLARNKIMETRDELLKLVTQLASQQVGTNDVFNIRETR